MLVGGEGLGLAAVAVQGEHQHAVQPLAQRIGPGQLAQLGDYLGVASQVQVGVNAGLQRLQPDLCESRDIAYRQQPGLHVSQRIAPPQRQPRACLGSGDVP